MTRYASKTIGLDTWSRAWEVSPKRPYTKPLPFQSVWRRETQYPFATPSGRQVNDYTYSLTVPFGNSEMTRLVYYARHAWVEKAKGGVSADLGLTFATWRSSLSMMAGAFKALARKAERAELYYSRKTSNLYLEGIFGWVPLINDVFSAMKVLSDLSPPLRKPKVRKIETLVNKIDDANHRGALITSLGVQVGGSLIMTNPNLALLERLGLVNPAAVAWDAVPYSFVINWFIPVGTFLKDLSDMVGWSPVDPYYTTFVRKEFAGEVQVWNPKSMGYVWMSRYIQQGSVNRMLGMPPRSFPPVGLPTADLYKATVALALLDQKLRDPLRRAWRTRNRYTE